jgi:hypothetical protein
MRRRGFIGDRRNFTINTTGWDANNTSRVDTGPMQHAFNFGADSFHDQVGTTGFGTIFTPSGERTVAGSFAQVKTNWANVVETIAAARYDKYWLSGGGVGTEGDRVSPKYTIGLTTIPGFTPYFIYAEGYRAPALTETLVAGIHPAAPQFTFLPNPGLKPEIGKNKEVGINLRYDNVATPGDAFRAKVNVFRNDLENYINLKFLGPLQGVGGQQCRNFTVFFCEQYQNIPTAWIEGIELETNYDAGFWFAGVAGSHLRGRDVSNNLPLGTIPPDQVTTTLGARFLDRRLTVSVRWQAVAAKNPDDIPPGPEAPAGATQGPPYAYYPTAAFNLINLYHQPRCAGVILGGKSAQFAIFALPQRGSESGPRREFDAAAVLQSGDYDQRRADSAIQRLDVKRRMTGHRLASSPPCAKLRVRSYWSPDLASQACVATAAWMTAILQPSTRRSKDVHCHEPLPGEEGIRTGVRGGVAQPRLAPEQGAWLRRIPPAAGTRARRLHALCVAYDLAKQECFRSLDQIGGISRRPQGCRTEQAALHRPSAIRGVRGSPDLIRRQNGGRLGFAGLEVAARDHPLTMYASNAISDALP